MAEHWSPKPGAAGSIPVSPATLKLINHADLRGFLLIFLKMKRVDQLKKWDDELNFNWGIICLLVEMIAHDGKK